MDVNVRPEFCLTTQNENLFNLIYCNTIRVIDRVRFKEAKLWKLTFDKEFLKKQLSELLGSHDDCAAQK